MKELIGNNKTMSSREIADLTGKDHRNVLRDCDVINEHYEKMSLLKIEQSYYVADNKQKYREYLLTKMQTMDLMTGYNVELRIKVNRRWEELETKPQSTIDNMIADPSFGIKLLTALKDEQEKRIEIERELDIKQQQIEEQAPAVIFKKSVEGSNTNVSVAFLANTLCQNGINIGQNRLYDWFVENKYLIRHKRWSNKKQKHMNDYTPTQRAADLKVFFVPQTVINPSMGASFIKHTIKVTGKGQTYFINKFLNQKA